MPFINNLPNINETFIIEPEDNGSGGTGTVSACTALYTNIIIGCDNDSIINLLPGEIDINKDLKPTTDATVNLGNPVERFRQINTVSGTSTYWTSGTAKITALSATTIDLGLDSQGVDRVLNADSSLLIYDTLTPGTY